MPLESHFMRNEIMRHCLHAIYKTPAFGASTTDPIPSKQHHHYYYHHYGQENTRCRSALAPL